MSILSPLHLLDDQQPNAICRIGKVRTTRTVVRCAMVLTTAWLVLPAPAWAHDPAKKTAAEKNANAEVERLPEVVVQGQEESMVGIADSATQGEISGERLRTRPLSRTGEILESVPGVIITQHAGGGKANQFFLRGFNLDHGTDFATSLDGMPINLVSHGHGQGYTDLNPIIPELVERIEFQKGVYDPRNGDFSSAGAARLSTYRVLPRSMAIVTGGMFGYGRAVFAASPKIGKGHLLFATELHHEDGPWERPNNFRKANALLTYSRGDRQNGWSLSGRVYHGEWESSDQVAQSAISTGWIGRYGTLDKSTGGLSQRYSLDGEWHRKSSKSATQLNAYVGYSDLDLFSNFTYFATDPVRGDQFEQVDKRAMAGVLGRQTHFFNWKSMELSYGFNLRHDAIRNGLYQTQDRKRVDKFDPAAGTWTPARTREDGIAQTSLGAYVEHKASWLSWLRTAAGVRGDVYDFYVDSLRQKNSGNKAAAIASPKLSLAVGPFVRTELYAQAGLGFHSNDARGVLMRVDPITGQGQNSEGSPIEGAHPLVRTRGAEFGIRTGIIRGLQSTVALWWLDLDSELVFVGDAGNTEATRKSRRYGVEWSNVYTIVPGLNVDADVAWSHARFRDKDPAGQYIPGAIESVIAAGASYRAPFGLFASFRLRYFGERPLVEDNSMRSKTAVQLNAMVGYEVNSTWTLTLEGFNLLNRKDHDIDYAYESRIRPDAAIVNERHFHPMAPLQLRLGLRAQF